MQIVDVKATVLESPAELRWKVEWPARRIPALFVRVIGDDGTEGQCITWLLSERELGTDLPNLRRVLIGRDPHDVEAISYELTDRLKRPSHVASTIDICLWDMLGKYHGVPTYKLLGAARDRIRAYASTLMYESIEEYVDLALECQAQGFTALKLHAFAIPEKDIEVCRAVREAVGPQMDLMLDPVNAYDRRGALKVGRVLEELDFYWYEAPIDDADIQGLTDLTRRLNIPVTAAESVPGGLRAYPQYLVGHAIDSVRSIGDRMGGISAMRKSAALCEAFNVKYEPHSYGSTSIVAAHLAVMLSIHHCDFVELPVPQGVLDYGMADVIRVESDGYVDAPTAPGLGYAVDRDRIAATTVREL